MASLTHIYRHPIKAIGYEALERATLREGRTLMFDRQWAVEHEASKYDADEGWGRCVNFVRGASSPRLMAVQARMLRNNRVSLSHPDLAPITIAPNNEEDAQWLVDWLKPICNPDRPEPVRLVRATKQGMTDNSSPFLSILNAASLNTLSRKIGFKLARERFRGNLWVEGFDAWSEFSWIGQKIQIGEAVLEVAERITRCTATTVNPETGISDADTLGALKKHWDHQDFGVFATVIQDGKIKPNDPVVLL